LFKSKNKNHSKIYDLHIKSRSAHMGLTRNLRVVDGKGSNPVKDKGSNPIRGKLLFPWAGNIALIAYGNGFKSMSYII
jgi:hypothetical protein